MAVTFIENSPNVGPLLGTTCRLLRVSMPLVPDIDVFVRVTPASLRSTPRGTVIFGAGTGGTDFYSGLTGGAALMATLRANGWRLVERAWKTPGWFSAGMSVRAASGRYDALVAYIAGNLAAAGLPIVATGNSGGAAEIAYGLTHWGTSFYLSGSVLTSGPPMTRLDWMCDDPPPAAWVTEAARVMSPIQARMSGVPSLSGATWLCPLLPTVPGYPGSLVTESIMATGVPSSWSARLHTIVGADDMSVAVPQAMLFHDAVTSAKVVTVVPGTPHWIPETSAGRDAIAAAVTAMAG